MAAGRGRFAIWGVCLLGGATLAIGVGIATGAKLETKSASVTIAEDRSEEVTAQCKRGKKAVSGGFDSHIAQSPPTEAIIPYRSLREGGRKWSSGGYNFAEPGDLTSFAYCRDQKVKRRTNETTLSDAGSDTVTARCPKGTRVASGGFDSPKPYAGNDAPAIFPFESKKSGKRKWTVAGTNLGNAPGNLVAQVNCHDRKGLKTAEEELFIDRARVHRVVAECASGQRVVSGGFDYSVEPSGFPGPTFVFSSHKLAKRSWEVKAIDFTPGPATLTAYAYCEKKKR
jgi:hypothetical protein